jgi:WD40 repeat protein
VWRVDAGIGLHSVLIGHEGAVNSIAYHPDGTQFATASDDKTIILWNATTNSRLATLPELDAGVRDVAFNADGTKLASAVGSEIIIWDMVSRRIAARISVEDDVWSLAFSPDGARVATTSLFEGAAVWDTATGKQVSRFTQGDSGYCVRFAPSGIVAASCGDERAIRVWKVETGRQLYEAVFHQHSVLSVAFDNRGRRIVTGCDDRTSRIWTVGTEPSEDNIVVLSGHDQGVNSAVFSPSGDHVLTASQDKTVRLWHSATGEQISVFTGHSDNVAKAVFSPSGERIVSVSGDKTIRIWDLFPDTQALVDYAKQVAPRGLTRNQREAFFLDPELPAWYRERKKWPYG